MNNNKRESSIELLKIFSIILIVVSHVTLTIGFKNDTVAFSEYIIPIGEATTDTTTLILSLFYQAGCIGNTIFFVCSCWFWVGKNKIQTNKIINTIMTVWILSVIFLCFYLILYPSEIAFSDIIKQLFPTIFANNWYMSNYILFLCIYPFINRFIECITKKEHLKIVIFTSSIWILGNYLKRDLFFPSLVLTWMSIYFLVSYLKLYCSKIIRNRKYGVLLLVCGVGGAILQVLITNFLGIYLNIFSNDILRWNSNSNPFYIMIAIGAMILSFQKSFYSNSINYIASLTMYIYLIHENYLFRNYSRPYIWQWIYDSYGYDKVIPIAIVFSIILFSVSSLIAIIYKETIQKLVNIVSNNIVKCLHKESTVVKKEKI